MRDAATVIYELVECRNENPNAYIKIVGFDNSRGIESCTQSFIVARPFWKPGFRLVRQEPNTRKMKYKIESYGCITQPIDTINKVEKYFNAVLYLSSSSGG